MENNHTEKEFQDFEKKAEKGLRKAINGIKKAKKKTKIILGIVLIIILIIIISLIFSKKDSPYDFASVIRGDVIQEVSATGKVEAAEEVDLRFKSSGIIDSINVKVGDQIKKGAYLVRLSAGDIQSQYQQAVASYNQAKAKLEQLLAGATTEEIKVAEQVVENARISFEDVKIEAENDLNEEYNNALVDLVDASSKANKSIADLKQIGKDYFYRSYSLDNEFNDKKSIAENVFEEAEKLVSAAIGDSSHANIDLALLEMKIALQKVINALDFAKSAMADPTIVEDVVATDRTTIDTDIANANNAYSNINSSINSISAQKITNQSNINTAESVYNKALVDLEELKAPPRQVDIAVYQADVDKYRANMNEYGQKLRDASIIAPFDGIVAKLDAKIGEVITSSDRIVVSLISPGNYQIRADISEADIEKVDLDDSVEIILDAFPEEAWQGRVVEIEPGETLVDGVVYYRIKIFFENISEGVRSGMTADATIQTDKKENVLNIPQRAIVYSDNLTFVRVLQGGEIKEVEVKTGSKGKNGEVEIINGLEENQEVITYIKK